MTATQPAQLIPGEDEIKNRIVELTLEANTLRGLLKLLRKQEETRRKIAPKSAKVQTEARHASVA